MIARLRSLGVLAALLGAGLLPLFIPAPAPAQTRLRVGWCAKTISSAATPFAVAAKMGWFKQDGVEVELVPLAGSGDCTKTVATREVALALPSVEPLAAARRQGVKAKIFYTAYQGNIYGIAVPADSPVQKMADLKGKTIGVISMGSAGVQIARALAATSGSTPPATSTWWWRGRAPRPPRCSGADRWTLSASSTPSTRWWRTRG